jgi:hypothetical protein
VDFEISNMTVIPEDPLMVEEWRMIPHELFPMAKRIYSISNYGLVYNLESKRIIPTNICRRNNSYISFHIRNIDNTITSIDLHRLIALVYNYIPGCESLCINHKDGVKFHNWIWNLEWVTIKENTDHAFKHNLIALGQDRKNTVLSNEHVHILCKLIKDGYSTKEIVDMLKNYFPKCDLRRIICNIKNGHSWSHISDQYDFSNSDFAKRILTESEIHYICNLFQIHGRKLSTPEILKLLGMDYYIMDEKTKRSYNTCISAIRNKKNFKEICDLYNY